MTDGYPITISAKVVVYPSYNDFFLSEISSQAKYNHVGSYQLALASVDKKKGKGDPNYCNLQKLPVKYLDLA